MLSFSTSPQFVSRFYYFFIYQSCLSCIFAHINPFSPDHVKRANGVSKLLRVDCNALKRTALNKD